MAVATRLGRGDVDRMLGVVGEAAAEVDGKAKPFDLPLIERLLELVPAERAGYYECDRAGPVPALSAQTVTLLWDYDAFRAAERSWPLRDGRARTALTALKLSDFLTSREQRLHPWCQEIMRPHSARHECKLWLQAPAGEVRALFFVRGDRDRDFSERDKAVLTVLRPHLSWVREQWQRRNRPAGLTDREVEVLQLLRVGLTNREIASRLVISSATVRTHLEHLFEKLGAHTRTAAVTRAFGR
jgi:DNA-binding CsgD family transcriptional regulator